MEALLLKPDRPAGFGRCVRDDKKNIIARLDFRHGEPQWLEGAELEAVQKDIGVALCYAELGPNGDPLGKPAKIQEPGGLDRLTDHGKAESPAVESTPVSGANGDATQNGEGKGRKHKR
jgi:hypothetical protein